VPDPSSSAAETAAEQGAAEVFKEALPVASRYADLLTGPGVERGIVGPAEAERIWDRHLLNCAAIARLIPVKCTLVDIGSGAGLPGIVLAILLPGVSATLLEAMARRVAFLEECVSELGLSNVEVVRGRAEEMAGRLSADVVTARAVAPLDKLAGLGLGLLRPGGKMLAIKGASADAELAKALPVLGRLGVTDAKVVSLGSAENVANATVVTFSAPARRATQRGGPAARGGSRPGGPGPQIGRGAVRSGPGKNARPDSRRGGG
jgi:16S rRNA (guanine527-N7)-methyltransferase